MSRPALLKQASYPPPAMMRAADPRSPAGQMLAWSDALGFLPPYLCPARQEEPAGHKLYVEGTPGEDAQCLEALRAVLTDADVPYFDFAAVLRRSPLDRRQAVLSWRSSADAVRAMAAIAARQMPRGDVVDAVVVDPARLRSVGPRPALRRRAAPCRRGGTGRRRGEAGRRPRRPLRSSALRALAAKLTVATSDGPARVFIEAAVAGRAA